MIKEAIEKILSLADTKTIKLHGIDYAQKELVPVIPPLPSALSLSTLTGLVDYVRSGLDGSETENMVIHVASPSQVWLKTKLVDPYAERAALIVCTLDHHGADFSFSKQHMVEEFIIGLQARFVRTDNLAKILRVVGNMKAEKMTSATDDGISQKVATGSGVVLMTEEIVPNPVSLKPYRTFREIEQPESNFVFRLSQRGTELPTCALHEADGGAWKLEAIQRIRDYFKAALPNIKVIA